MINVNKIKKSFTYRSNLEVRPAGVVRGGSRKGWQLITTQTNENIYKLILF